MLAGYVEIKGQENSNKINVTRNYEGRQVRKQSYMSLHGHLHRSLEYKRKVFEIFNKCARPIASVINEFVYFNVFRKNFGRLLPRF